MHLNKEINPDYISLKDDFQSIIRNFDDVGVLFDDGQRNKIRKIPVKKINLNVKSFKIPNLMNQVAYKYIRKSKARRSFEYANILIDKNIGTPQPIAYYEFSSPLGLQHSYYFSEHVDFDLTYRKLVSDPDYPNHEKILRQFTKFTWQMHEKGIFFKDHSPGNTLMVKNGEKYDFYLVDLNRMKFFELDFNARIKNFSKLTPKKEMVKIMSDEYAKLIQEPFEKVYKKMWEDTEKFQEKFFRKKRLKEKLLGREIPLREE